jgi:hypothetical protein
MTHINQEHTRYGRDRLRGSDDLGAPLGFASTAVYFERLAKKEVRDHD